MVSLRTKTPGIWPFGSTPAVMSASIRDRSSRVLDGARGLSRYLNRQLNNYHSISSAPHRGSGPASALVRDGQVGAFSSGADLDDLKAAVGDVA